MLFNTVDPAPPTWLALPETAAKLLIELRIDGVDIMPADQAKLLQKAGKTLGQFNESAPEKKIDWKTSKTTSIDNE